MVLTSGHQLHTLTRMYSHLSVFKLLYTHNATAYAKQDQNLSVCSCRTPAAASLHYSYICWFLCQVHAGQVHWLLLLYPLLFSLPTPSERDAFPQSELHWNTLRMILKETFQSTDGPGDSFILRFFITNSIFNRLLLRGWDVWSLSVNCVSWLIPFFGSSVPLLFSACRCWLWSVEW